MSDTVFDLNDIEHEPSDAQLSSLMQAVAQEARNKAETARNVLQQNVQSAIQQAVRQAREIH
ncbi:hypothetical protein [Azovibrio restrictus]|uniref:hypothetical protein n=1 Tax=Azovibrio restrictus TaxID=146938 RepID=UPI0026EB39DA|nr:hypothetical protein [Azovibrio restrictus]MDD3483763.1 hypothetical protein [Azovibrio restrictus]